LFAGLGILDIPMITLALAVVATLGYLVGRRRVLTGDAAIARSQRDLQRAQAVARELEKIACTIRRNLAGHHRSLNKFKQRVGDLDAQSQDTSWKELYREADEMLTPTLRLSTQLATAYDQIRQQTNHLMTFTEVRTDALTGIVNRRGLDESLSGQLALASRYGLGFSLAMFDIDHFKDVNDEHGHLHGDKTLQQVARLLDESAREPDIVGRYGGEEFVVVMPHTDLQGACIFAERFRLRLHEETGLTVSAGVTVALDGDTVESILSRADAAMYEAKTAGRNRVLRHTGQQIEPIYEQLSVVSCQLSGVSDQKADN
jgi:diguanylate cyclase (GGDEF)-like protein